MSPLSPPAPLPPQAYSYVLHLRSAVPWREVPLKSDEIPVTLRTLNPNSSEFHTHPIPPHGHPPDPNGGSSSRLVPRKRQWPIVTPRFSGQVRIATITLITTRNFSQFFFTIAVYWVFDSCCASESLSLVRIYHYGPCCTHPPSVSTRSSASESHSPPPSSSAGRLTNSQTRSLFRAILSPPPPPPSGTATARRPQRTTTTTTTPGHFFFFSLYLPLMRDKPDKIRSHDVTHFPPSQ